MSELLNAFFDSSGVTYTSMCAGAGDGERAPYVLALSKPGMCYTFIVWLTPKESVDVQTQGLRQVLCGVKPFFTSMNISTFFALMGENENKGAVDAVDAYESSRRAYSDLCELFLREELLALSEMVTR